MSGREDTRIVDHLYGELSEKEAREYERDLAADPAMAAEEESFESTLGLMRQLEDEEPPGHLDSLILARAREEAVTLAEKNEGLGAWLKKMIRKPAFGLALAGSVAVVIAVVTVPASMQSPDLAAPAMELDPGLRDQMAAKAPPRGNLAEGTGMADGTGAEGDLRNGMAKQEPPPPPAELQKEAEDEQRAGGLAAREMPKAAAKRDEANERSRSTRGGERAPAKDFAFDDAPAEKAEEKAANKPARRPADSAETTADSKVTANEALGGANRITDGLAEAKKKAPEQPAPVVAQQPQAEPQTKALEREEMPAEDAVTETAAKRKAPAQSTSAGPVVADKEKKGTAAGQGSVATTSPAEPMSGAQAATYARDLIAAAESQLASGDRAGARRVLVNGLARTRGTTAYGDLALRLAQLDYAERRLADASRNAKAAAAVPRFPRKKVALDLVERVAAEQGNEADRAWAREAEKSAAPAATDEAY